MNLNTDFDLSFENIKDLKWLPWVGTHYNNSQTIILGESQYEDGDEWQENNKNSTRTLIDKRFTGSKGKIYTNVEKVLLNSSSVTQECGNKVWKSVSYYNLVQRLMGSIKERPTDADFDKGWEIFLNVAEVIQPKLCIVLCQSSGRLGYYLNNNVTSWERNVSEFYNKEKKVINISQNGKSIKLIFINHPSGSRSFDYSRWAQLIHNEEPSLYTQLT